MRRANQGFTLVEIMIVVAIIALLAAIAIPNVLRGRTTANESAAIGNSRALMSGLEMYRSVNSRYPQDENWGGGGVTTMYPAGLPGFGPPSFGTAAIGAVLAAPDTVQGYTYTYATIPAACIDGNNDCAQYTMLVVPQNNGRTGTRAFFLNETGVVRHCQCVAPPAACGATAGNGAAWNTIDQGPTTPCT